MRHSAFFRLVLALAGALFLLRPSAEAQQENKSFEPGQRVLMDAHNCYPYFEWWGDRIDRALGTGTPLAIEQDLVWYHDPKTGQSRSVVAHGEPLEGFEPSMRDYFFERIRSLVERAIREGNHGNWPIITLNLDVKTEEPEHLRAIWNLLREYQEWLTTAPKSGDIANIGKLDLRPVLVLTGESEEQKRVFFDEVPDGQRLIVFGATPTHTEEPLASPEKIEPTPRDNYHRWWNNFWGVVEVGGPSKAGEWTLAKQERLRSLVRYAHKQGLWIRFYTLDGVPVPKLSCFGWSRNYNFGAREAVVKRWNSAIAAGVDFIATDQYEELAGLIKRDLNQRNLRPSGNPFLNRDIAAVCGSFRCRVTQQWLSL